VQLLDVIDLGVIEVLERQRIDVELHPVALELLVHLPHRLLEVEVVGEARAATADDPQPQPLPLQVLRLGDLLDLARRAFRDRDHLRHTSTLVPCIEPKLT
jgi:hypothetical protein